jgi:hypothetical protein
MTRGRVCAHEFDVARRIKRKKTKWYTLKELSEMYNNLSDSMKNIYEKIIFDEVDEYERYYSARKKNL